MASKSAPTSLSKPGYLQLASAIAKFFKRRAQNGARKTVTRIDQASERQVRSLGRTSRRSMGGLVDYAHDSMDVFAQFLLGMFGLETDTDQAIADRARARAGKRMADKRARVIEKERDRKARERRHQNPSLASQMPRRDKQDPRPVHRWLFGLPVGDRSGKRWTRRDDRVLAILVEQNYTARQAAQHLGRSESSVRARAARLGLYFSK